MKLEDIKGFKYYLENDCYCRYEIYSLDGFFYQIFKPEFECVLLTQKDETIDGGKVISRVIVTAKPYSEKEDASPQVLLIVSIDGIVKDATRLDATDNNVQGLKKWLLTGEKFSPDEYENGATAKALKDILSIADAVIIS